MSGIPISLMVSVYKYADGDIPDNAELVSTEYLTIPLTTTYDPYGAAPGATLFQNYAANTSKKIKIIDSNFSTTGLWHYLFVPGLVIFAAPASSGTYDTSVSNPDRFYVKETEYEDGLA